MVLYFRNKFIESKYRNQIDRMSSRTTSELILLTRTRKSLGVSQELMATYLGTSREMVSMIENGLRNLTLGHKAALLSVDLWMNPDLLPDERVTAERHELWLSEAAQWLSRSKSRSNAMLEMKRHELRSMQKDYDRSREIVNRLRGAAPAGITKPLAARWVQRVVWVHEGMMEKCGPLSQMKLRVEMAKLEAVISLSV